ncbi:MAG TPA: signal recognition particle-docking protein FtsY [Opitutae bacterium]|nr:signal recognition particle-docking protein FtsY [Opitutae bacterium]|tara:strand:+ start:470 stop:1405 length:936 start_codon:yes stop_codon:yes gene_type:complete
MGIFSRFKKGLQKGAQAVQGALSAVTGRGSLDEEGLLRIEEAFYESDFGVEATEEIMDSIREAHRSEKELRGEDAGKIARTVVERFLQGSEALFNLEPAKAPEVLCMIGVNGSGKTTTCAKLAHRLEKQGSKVVLGACDTFRAAATEQLKSWSDRLDLEIVAGHHGADSAAVAFDAYSAGESRGHDLVIIDTAGRLHVKENLMDELAKMKRVLQKRSEEAPHHSWLVIDGSTGTNVLEQAKAFHEKFGLTGLVVTKLDGTGKGGAVVSIYRQLKLPIYFIGLGESPEDLQPFSIEHYLDSIFPPVPIGETV